MVDESVAARVNLYAVLRALEELAVRDSETAKLAGGRSETIKFSVGGVGKARLTVGGGTIRFEAGNGPCSISLWFPDAKAFNAMIAGTGNPIPLKGFTKIGYLTGTFAKLADRLGHFLKPDAEKLRDSGYRDVNAALSIGVAAFAISEVGNHDADGKLNAARMADGEILVAASGGPELTVASKDGRLETRRGASGRARAWMRFPGLEEAGAMLRGEVDAYGAIGAGQVSVGGYIPLVDHMNKILGLVARYV